MRTIQPKSGDGVLINVLNSLEDYLLVTVKEAWRILKERIMKEPDQLVFNDDMQIKNLEKLLDIKRNGVKYIVGFGGGTACDTAKYLSWKLDLPLIIAPSIISVDAWLCRSIAVRIDHRVKYVGDIEAEAFVVDFSLIKSAPKELNLAGIGDILSIAPALGDWVIAREEFGEHLDQKIFESAKQIVIELFSQAKDISSMDEEGINAIVKGQIAEVVLCEGWGNARPEEGSEHFLAYCLENITHDHYMHGNLIALNILIVLKLQKERAVFDLEEVLDFLNSIGISFNPKNLKLKRGNLRRALKSIQKYCTEEKFPHGLWSLPNVFESEGEYSIEGILDWVYNLK